LVFLPNDSVSCDAAVEIPRFAQDGKFFFCALTKREEI